MTTNFLDEFKEINAKFNSLKDRAMKINAVVENSSQQADKFKEAAIKKFGISTPEELLANIEKTEKENIEKIAQYRKDVENFGNEVQTKEELIKKIQEDNQ